MTYWNIMWKNNLNLWRQADLLADPSSRNPPQYNHYQWHDTVQTNLDQTCKQTWFHSVISLFESTKCPIQKSKHESISKVELKLKTQQFLLLFQAVSLIIPRNLLKVMILCFECNVYHSKYMSWFPTLFRHNDLIAFHYRGTVICCNGWPQISEQL